MSAVLKIFGTGLILLSALIFTREYEKKIRLKEETSEGFLLLITHIKRKIDCYLTPPSELVGDFSNSVLLETGFLDLAKKEGVASAYMLKRDSLLIYESVKSELTSHFSSFGKEYKEGTLRALCSAESSLKELIDKEKEQGEKDLKVVRTLAVSLALGAVILII